TLHDTSTVRITPTPGENVTDVTVYAVCADGYYYCVAQNITQQPDGTFTGTFDAEELFPGENYVRANVSYTDAFGQEHGYTPPSIPVTVQTRQHVALSVETTPTRGPAPLSVKFKITAENASNYTINFGDGSAEEEGTI